METSIVEYIKVLWVPVATAIGTFATTIVVQKTVKQKNDNEKELKEKVLDNKRIEKLESDIAKLYERSLDCERRDAASQLKIVYQQKEIEALKKGLASLEKEAGNNVAENPRIP